MGNLQGSLERRLKPIGGIGDDVSTHASIYMTTEDILMLIAFRAHSTHRVWSTFSFTKTGIGVAFPGARVLRYDDAIGLYLFVEAPQQDAHFAGIFQMASW